MHSDLKTSTNDTAQTRCLLLPSVTSSSSSGCSLLRSHHSELPPPSPSVLTSRIWETTMGPEWILVELHISEHPDGGYFQFPSSLFNGQQQRMNGYWTQPETAFTSSWISRKSSTCTSTDFIFKRPVCKSIRFSFSWNHKLCCVDPPSGREVEGGVALVLTGGGHVGNRPHAQWNKHLCGESRLGRNVSSILTLGVPRLSVMMQDVSLFQFLFCLLVIFPPTWPRDRPPSYV